MKLIAVNKDNYMEKTIEMAKCTLSEMFQYKRDDIDIRTRKRKVVEARRFLIYFMIMELGIKFSFVPKYLKSIRSHASAMHHYYKMMDLLNMKHEKKLRSDYDNFKSKIMTDGLGELEQELNRQIILKREISNKIKQLKKMIDER